MWCLIGSVDCMRWVCCWTMHIDCDTDPKIYYNVDYFSVEYVWNAQVIIFEQQQQKNNDWCWTTHRTEYGGRRGRNVFTLSEILYSAQNKVCIIVSSDLEIVIDRLNGYDVCRLCASQLTEPSAVCVCVRARLHEWYRLNCTRTETERPRWKDWQKKNGSKRDYICAYNSLCMKIEVVVFLLLLMPLNRRFLSRLIVWCVCVCAILIKCAHESKTLTVIKRLFTLPFWKHFFFPLFEQIDLCY